MQLEKARHLAGINRFEQQSKPQHSIRIVSITRLFT
jgi:hypothetical protein